ncbi:coiled-coil domain-containing protein [Myroides odoratimimus]|uniref:coiled-coil domain-containing protein n=1 Tax=Myroides odoratimimus TaxID=76832 RepID=UPI00370C1FAB
MQPENFTDHIVFEKLEQLKQALASDNAQEKIGIDNFSFFEMTYLFINDRLKLTISVLVQDAELANLASEIEAGTSQINSFLGNKNIGHLNNAKNNFNSALTRIRNFPLSLSKTNFDFSKVIASFQKTVEDAYKTLEVSNIKLQENLKATQQDLVDKNTQITDLQQKLANKEVEIQNVLNNYNIEFESIKTINNNTFDAEKKKFNDSIEADRKAFKELIDSDKDSYKQEYEKQKSDLEKQTVETVKELQSKLEEAKKIVNIVGNVGVTGNYQKIAEQHKKSANFFRWVALGFMVMMSGLLIYSIIDLSSDDFDLYKSLVRILAASVLTYPAIYASRESTKHRNLETQNRNLELELASIGPFIELLPEVKKEAIKEELVKKYFGQQANIYSDNKDDDVSINGLEKILKMILPFVKK